MLSDTVVIPLMNYVTPLHLIKHKPSAHQKCVTLLLASALTCKANIRKCHNYKVKWRNFESIKVTCFGQVILSFFLKTRNF